MAYEPDDLSGFLSHRTRESGGGFMKNWRKEPGFLHAFLHTRVMPIAIWQHGLPRIHIQEKDGEDAVRRVFFGDYNCWEDERTLKAQFKRDNEGNRTHPPQKCPVCRLVECLRDMVDERQINWLQPVFRFDADDPKETRILHAGGMYGHFGRDDLTPQEKKEMSAAGLSQKVDWNQNTYAKGKYLFYLVDADKVEAGVQQTVEAAQLGDKVKDVINDAQDGAENPDLGNPFINPYCIKFEFKDVPGDPYNKYKARRMDRIKPTPDILELIRGDRPDTARATAPFDGKTMRSILERHCLIKNMPWDHIFAGVKLEGNAVHPDIDDASMEFPVKPKMVGDADRNRGLPYEVAQSVLKGNADEVLKKPAAPVEEVACDTCNKGMPETALICPHCDQHYAMVNGQVVPVEKPAEPRPRKRSDPR